MTATPRLPDLLRCWHSDSSHAGIAVNWIQCPFDGSTIVDSITETPCGMHKVLSPLFRETNSWVKSG